MKIGQKLFMGYIAMAFLTVAVLWVIQAGVLRDSYLNERLQSVDKALEGAIDQQRLDYDELVEALNINLVVTRRNGEIIYRSQGLPMMGMMIRSIRAAIPELKNGQVSYIDNAARTGRYALLGRTDDSERFFFAVIALADVDEAAKILRHQLWIVTAVLLLMASLLAIFLSRRLSRPIQAVTAAARELSTGQLAVKLPVSSQDEIGQLTEALNDLSEELQKTDHLRKALIANVSHELRAPLAVIQGYAETVRDVTWPDETKRGAQLTIIAEEAAFLTAVVRDILDYSRLQAGVEKPEKELIPLKPFLEHFILHYEQQLQAASLRVKLDCHEVSILFDPLRLTQIMHNLMNNAINHADPEREIEILAWKLDQERCRILVRNKGITIAAEELPHIWERFHRAGRGKGQIRGSGLGLAIVKSILQQHQSTYGVTSQDGVTTFWFDADCRKKAEEVS